MTRAFEMRDKNGHRKRNIRGLSILALSILLFRSHSSLNKLLLARSRRVCRPMLGGSHVDPVAMQFETEFRFALRHKERF